MLMSKRKFINVLGLFIALVLCWKLTWCQTKERTLKIGLFIDEKNTRLQTALLQLVSNFTNDFYDMYTGGIKLDIDVIFISEEPISRIPSLFCSRILKRQVTAIITHTTSAKKTQFIASLASHFCIPVVGTITDNPLLSERTYNTFIRTVPSEDKQFAVVWGLLKYTGRSDIFVIVGDDFSHGLAHSYLSRHQEFDSHIITIDRTNLFYDHLNQVLLQIKSSVRPVIFLYCDARLAKTLLWYAKDFKMIDESFLWIISESIVRETNDFYTLPSLIYGIRMMGSEDVIQFQSERLLVGLELLMMSLVPTATSGNLIEGPSKDCFGPGGWHQGKMLYRDLKRSAESTTIPNCCDDVSFSYQLLYLQEGADYMKQWHETGICTNGTVTLHRQEKPRTAGRSSTGVPVLRAAVMDYPPLTMKTILHEGATCQGIVCYKHVGSDARNAIKYCCFGLAIDVLKHVSGELQFMPYVYFVPDGNYGSFNSTTKQWNGIVKELLDGKCDISIDLMANEARSRYIDFSLRWTFAGLALLFKVGQKKVETIDFSFFEPFTPQLWLGMIGVVNLYLLVLWITDRLSPYGSYRTTQRRKHANHDFTILGSMWYCWGMCFDNQFVDARPRSYSAKTMAIFMAMFALLCLTSYTANLTAHLLSDDTTPGISGIRDLKAMGKNPKYTYGVVKSSYVDSFFELNEDPAMRDMFRVMQGRGYLVRNFTVGVGRVQQGTMDIFISELLSLDYVVAKQKLRVYPRLQVVGATTPFAESGYSYAFRKNSPWKPKFDLVINKLKAENKPSELYKKWVSAGATDGEERPENLDHRTLSGVFFLGASLALLACLFLYVEHKLYSFGFLYRNLHTTKKPEEQRRQKRKFPTDVQKKLLLGSKAKAEPEYPDISVYMAGRRRGAIMALSVYNPGRARKKQDSNGLGPSNNGSATSSV